MDTLPRQNDTDYNLVFKIVALLSARTGGQFPPQPRDTYNTLLRKWAFLTVLTA